MDKQDWTSKELAAAAEVTRRHINQLCARGSDGPFPGARLRATAWFIPYDEGTAWMDARKPSKQESGSG